MHDTGRPRNAPTAVERRLLHGAWLALALVCLLLAWQHRGGWPLATDLMQLLPQGTQDSLRQEAQRQVNAPLAHQLIVLVGERDAGAAHAAARAVAQRLQASTAFSQVRFEFDVDVPALRASLLAARLAMLPARERDLLLQDPAAYLRQRAQDIVDPFAGMGSVPLGSDLLGLTRPIERALQPSGQVRMDLPTRTLQARTDDETWVLILARTRQGSLAQQEDEPMAAAMADARRIAAAAGARFLAAGGPLYAAAGSAQARQESTRIGLVSLAGIVLVLLFTLGRVRALLALLPVAAGLLAGTAACVAVFGQIHVLTLVIGMSLIGVAIDFPMHWLGKRYGMAHWQAWPAMRQVRPGLTLSLATTLVGYAALALAPFPALTQTAVFSVAGLAAAYACTVLALPALFQRWRPRTRPCLTQAAARALAGLARLRRLPGPVKWLALAAVAAACLIGVSRLDMRDDLRQWISVPPGLMAEAARIGEITGMMPTSQFFLVRAPDPDTLLERQAALAQRLDAWVGDGRLHSYAAPGSVVAPVRAQEALRAHFAALAQSPRAWQPLVDVGLPAAAVQAELQALAALPVQPLDAVLQSALAERWRSLYLGMRQEQAVGLVTLQGLSSAQGLAGLAQGLPGVELVDGTGELNALFHDTRLTAAELKLASYALAALMLWLMWGAGATWRILAVPLAASACTLAVLGYLGQPLTLFALFGLLLVSAISVDYAIFMYEGIAGAPTCLVGVGLGALTTLLSFGTLALSATPAIANFGLAVAIGVLFSAVISACLGLRSGARHAS